ncbi:MAG: anthranilate phosphoribosyltransferase [Deltaproteobacteria bacterium]|nr:anthranilate phosphoribosyltransferase [Deltaproteobacteria bacterium]
MREFLERLFRHGFLSVEESRAILKEIAAGKYAPTQVAAFLTVFCMRPIGVDELQGFRAAMLDLCLPVDLSPYDAVDLVGTGGDGKDTFNISTLAALVTVGAGQRVAKHGNYAASSVCGASNVLEQVGVYFPKTAAQAQAQIERSGFCFLHAPIFHPAMKHLAPIRKELGVRTFFNLLGPLVNPAAPPAQVVGVATFGLQRLYHYLLQQLGVKYVVLHSLDGYDEISLTSPCLLQGRNEERLLEPKDWGCQAVRAQDLSGGRSVTESAEIFMRILQGQGTPAQERVVCVNAAAALKLCGRAADYKEAVEMARESLRSGKALAVLEALRQEGPKT